MKIEWSTQKRKVKDLILYEKNPRKMTDKQKNDLLKSLRKFDLVEIPAINTDNVVCAGNQRVMLLKLEGRESEEIDVRVPNRKLTDEEFEEYCLRSNKNTGEWNFDLLAKFDEELLKNVGWESEELGKILSVDEILTEKEEEIKMYKSAHILLSFHPDIFSKIKPHIDEILKIGGVEIEQSTN